MNHSKDDGTTPLHAAVHEEDTEAIKRLLEAGARIDLTNDEGMSPLQLALKEKKFKSALTLMEGGADVNTVDMSGSAALHLAAGRADSELISALIRVGADLDARDKVGATALHRVIRATSDGANRPADFASILNSMRLLVDSTASIDATNDQRQTPLHWAVRWPHTQAGIVQFLIDEDANVNAADKEGSTPLHEAVRANKVEFARLLIEAGAKVDIRTNPIQGKTPAELAGENVELLQLLEAAKATNHE